MGTVRAGNADFFLLPLAFARCLEQPKHRLRHIRIANEGPLHRTNVVRAGSSRERKIGRIGIGDVAAGVGDRDTVVSKIGNAMDDRVVG